MLALVPVLALALVPTTKEILFLSFPPYTHTQDCTSPPLHGRFHTVTSLCQSTHRWRFSIAVYRPQMPEGGGEGGEEEGKEEKEGVKSATEGVNNRRKGDKG